VDRRTDRRADRNPSQLSESEVTAVRGKSGQYSDGSWLIIVIKRSVKLRHWRDSVSGRSKSTTRIDRLATPPRRQFVVYIRYSLRLIDLDPPVPRGTLGDDSESFTWYDWYNALLTVYTDGIHCFDRGFEQEIRK